MHSDSACDDPCLPYLSTEELVAEFAGEPAGGLHRLLEAHAGPLRVGVPEGAQHPDRPAPAGPPRLPRRLYDAGIRKLDGELAGLFAELERRGFLEDCLVVVTADHGEAFMEHGRMLHSVHFDEVLNVPFVVRLPERFGVEPARVDELTQSIDLAPTVLELCGLEPMGQGQSLAATVLLGDAPQDRPVMFHQNVLIGVDNVSPYKYVRTKREPVYFDRGADPGERTNLLADSESRAELSGRVEELDARLQEMLQRSWRVHEALRTGGEGAAELSPERVQELKALGYF